MQLIRPWLFLVTATFLVACGASNPRPIPEIVERARTLTVTVEIEQDPLTEARLNPLSNQPELVSIPPAIRTTAGLVIDDGLVLTSAHAVDSATGVAIRLPEAEAALPASIVGVSVCDDLALLQVEAEALKAPDLNERSDVELGAQVLTISQAPVGGWEASPLVSTGIVTWRSPERDGLATGSLLLSNAALPARATSAPLFSAAGELVGLLVRGRFSAPAQYSDYVIGIGYAQSVAAELRERGSILRLGMDLVELADRPGATSRSVFLRLFGDDARAGGLFVRGIAPDVAAQSGLRSGDLLLQVGGRPVPTLSDLCGVMAAYAGGASAPVVALRLDGGVAQRIQATITGGAPAITEASGEASQATPTPPPPTEVPLPTPAAPAPVAAVNLGPAEQQAARDALAAERAQYQELFFETFDSEATKRRWTPVDDAARARRLVYSYYQLTLKQPGAIVSDAWPERPLGSRHIVELDVALPPTGTAAVGITFDQQTDGSGLSYFVIGADGSWQVAAFQGGALVPGYYARGTSPSFVAGGGTNFLRVVRQSEGVQFWLNDTLVARAAPGPFAGGHPGVIALAGTEPLPQPINLIADNMRVLEQP